jgi:phenylalanyl-tRNA synthetase beta chain
VEPHPDAERLRVCRVFDGEVEHVVVCGGPNVAAGQRIAFAPVGVTLPNGVTLERRMIRGVESNGMICGEDELGLIDTKAEEILVLKPRSKPGKPLAQVLQLTDVIYELSVTPNRADCLSHHGIARELAALYGIAHPKLSMRVREAGKPASSLAKVEIKDGKRCPKYVARVLTGVKVGPSPSWVKQRLKAVGVRSISNVVDATNLVLMELGHPLHAFDLDKLGGQRIVVRTAKQGEKLLLLDGKTIELDKEDLVIADAEVPVALAGVMGGAASEVSEGTTSILLESAMFDPVTVRRTAKRYGLHTEASHRFERGADPEMVEVAIDRCAQIIVEISESGTVHKGRVSQVKSALEPKVVPIRPDRATLVIGRSVSKQEIRDSLSALGLKPAKAPSTKDKKKKPAKDALYFRVPSWRVDLSLEEDLIEEVARLAGYDEIPTLMPPSASDVWTHAPERDFEREVREALVSEGLYEAISLAFNSRKVAEDLGLDTEHAVQVANPLGEESALMRLSMLPALLGAARLNQDNLPSTTDLRLFEMGKTFVWTTPPNKLPKETRRIGILMRGHRFPQDWTARKEMLDAFDLKAVIEALLARFCIRATFEPHDAAWLHPRSGTRIEADGRTLGLFGEAHPGVMDRFGLEGPPVFVAELELDAMLHAVGPLPVFRPLPKLPPAQRDLSFFVDRDVPSAKVLGIIEEAGRPADLESVSVFDVYEGKGVPEGKKSIAVAMTFRSDARTLTDSDVEAAQASVVAALTERLNAEIRSGK